MNRDERIASLIRSLLTEPDPMARARVCDAWAQSELAAGADAADCAGIIACAVAATDTLLGVAAARSPGEAVH